MQETKQAFRRSATQAPIPDTYSTNLQDMAFRIAKGHKTHRKKRPFARQYATFYNSGKNFAEASNCRHRSKPHKKAAGQRLSAMTQ